MKQVYKCDFCTECFLSEQEAKQHEEKCPCNPKNKIEDKTVFRLAMLLYEFTDILATALINHNEEKISFVLGEFERVDENNCPFMVYQEKGRALYALRHAENIKRKRDGVIKALDICGHLEGCAECPLGSLEGIDKCMHTLLLNALVLINRLQADNSNLTSDLISLQSDLTSAKAENEQWKEEANKYQNLWCEAFKDIQTAKSEAVKEFAERIKDILRNNINISNMDYDDIADDIDNLLKELDGKENSVEK